MNVFFQAWMIHELHDRLPFFQMPLLLELE